MRIKELRNTILPTAYKLGRPVIIEGKSGIGKTQIAGSFATDIDAAVLLIKVSQYGELEFKGLPGYAEHEQLGRVTAFTPGMIIAMAWDLSQGGKKRVVVLVDELGNARGPVQVALYELFESGSLGGHSLPPDTVLIGTTNRANDNASVFKLAAPLVNRVILIEDVENPFDDWLEWGLKEAKPELHASVVAYHKFTDGKNLHTYDPETYGTKGYPFATPRSWKVVSDLMHITKDRDVPHVGIVQGLIGKGCSSEFVGFCKYFEQVPTREEVEQNPEKARVPAARDLSAGWASAAAVCSWSNNKNMDSMMIYLGRLPKTFQISTVRDLNKKHAWFATSKFFVDWAAKHGEDLAGF